MPVTHAKSKPAEIFYFKEVTAAPATSAQKHTHADPVLSEVVDIISRGKRGVMTQSLKPYEMNFLSSLDAYCGVIASSFHHHLEEKCLVNSILGIVVWSE